MDSSNTKYNNIVATVVAIVFLTLSAIAILFYKQSKDLNAALSLANKKLITDSLSIIKYELTEDELLKIVDTYENSGRFMSKMGNVLLSLESVLQSYANENNTFRKQIAEGESQILRLKSQNNSSENQIIVLETDLILQKNLLDSVTIELERIKSELSRTALDSLVIFSPNDSKIYYYGKIFNQSPQGFGIGFYEGKGYYIGEWKGNLRNGWGRHTFKDDSVYEGYFENDSRGGFGTYIYNSGEIYRGNWKDDLMDGKGEIIESDGKSIKGIWERGKLMQSD